SPDSRCVPARAETPMNTPVFPAAACRGGRIMHGRQKRKSRPVIPPGGPQEGGRAMMKNWSRRAREFRSGVGSEHRDAWDVVACNADRGELVAREFQERLIACGDFVAFFDAGGEAREKSRE